jgi:hypothetical protein
VPVVQHMAPLGMQPEPQTTQLPHDEQFAAWRETRLPTTFSRGASKTEAAGPAKNIELKSLNIVTGG